MVRRFAAGFSKQFPIFFLKSAIFSKSRCSLRHEYSVAIRQNRFQSPESEMTFAERMRSCVSAAGRTGTLLRNDQFRASAVANTTDPIITGIRHDLPTSMWVATEISGDRVPGLLPRMAKSVSVAAWAAVFPSLYEFLKIIGGQSVFWRTQ